MKTRSPDKNRYDKKAIFGWVMYDFANSSFTTLIVTFIYATYFAKAIAPDFIRGTILWGRAITVSALCVGFVSPLLGAIADQNGLRKHFLFCFTAIAVCSSAMLYTALPGEIATALIWFIIGNISYELGAVFYNAFLPDIAPPKKTGLISGLGWGLGYLGGLMAMFIAMVGFVNPEIPWFGFSKEAGQNIRATNLLVALWFGLFSLPALILLREKNSPTPNRYQRSFSFIEPFLTLKATLTQIRKHRQIVRFLVARLFYNDALITIFAFGGIYAAGTFNFSFQEIMIFGIVLNITAGIGALCAGFYEDHFGSLRTILITIAGLILASSIAVFTPNKTMFWVAGIMVGLCAGPNQSASRSMMAQLIPLGKQSQFFGFFAFAGKSTAFAGPLFLSLVTNIFDSQRLGMAVVIIFLLTGALLLSRVEK